MMMIQRIKADDLKKRMESGERMQLIDVRTPQEYAEAHLPCSINLPIEQVDRRLDDMNVFDPIVLICQSGTRACVAHQVLATHRNDLAILEGGTTAWEGAGLPVVRSTSARLPLMRQVQLVAGPMALVGSVLAITLDPGWALLSGFVGLGLTVAGATGFCGLASVLGILPWNRPTPSKGEPRTVGAS